MMKVLLYSFLFYAGLCFGLDFLGFDSWRMWRDHDMAHYRFASFTAHLYTRHLHLQVGQMSFGTEQMGQLSIENIDAKLT